MSKRRHYQKRRMAAAPLLAICGIVALNGYALHELTVMARSWKMTLLPGSVSIQLYQLAIILGVNCIVIVYLLIDRLAR